MAFNKDGFLGLTNLISDAYLDSFGTPTFQKAIYFDKSDYILTASGNKVSKNSILCGVKNIHMLGKSVIKSEAVLRGDLSNLYFGKYVIVGSNTLICPCFLSNENAENDENSLYTDEQLNKEEKKCTDEENDEENNDVDDDDNDTDDEEEEEEEEEDDEKESDSQKCPSSNKKENETNTNNTTGLKKKKKGKKKLKYSYLTLTIGDNVYIGNNCVVKAAFIGNNVFIGDNCIIGERVIIKDNVIIKNNTVIPNDIIIAPFSKYSGCPAKFVKELPESAEIFLKDFSYMHYKKFLIRGN